MQPLDEDPIQIKYTELIERMRGWIEQGGELSWFTMDNSSWDWADINENIEKFFNTLSVLNFWHVSLGWYFPKTKKTIYEAFEVIH